MPFLFEFEIDPSVHIDEDSKYVLIGNHGGWLGLEIAILYSMALWCESIADNSVFTHMGFLINPLFKHLIDTVVPPSMSVPSDTFRLLDTKLPSIFIIFPEGESGTCKSTIINKYKCQPFKKGFLHVASQHQRDIIIMTIIGNEDLFPSLGKLEFALFGETLELPVPLPFFPCEHRYRIKFHRLISHKDVETTNDFAERIRTEVQRYIDDRLSPNRSTNNSTKPTFHIGFTA